MVFPVTLGDPYLPQTTLTCNFSLAYPIFTARRNARIASAVLAIAIPSVCPYVCPSVCDTPVLCQNDGT